MMIAFIYTGITNNKSYQLGFDYMALSYYPFLGFFVMIPVIILPWYLSGRRKYQEMTGINAVTAMEDAGYQWTWWWGWVMRRG